LHLTDFSACTTYPRLSFSAAMAFMRSIVMISALVVAAADNENSPSPSPARMLNPTPVPSPSAKAPTPEPAKKVPAPVKPVVPPPAAPVPVPAAPVVPQVGSGDVNTWTMPPKVVSIYNDAKRTIDAMPVQEKTGVVVAGVAGVAALGGAIGGIAQAVHKSNEPRVVVVDVPFEVPVTDAGVIEGPGFIEPAGAPKAVSKLYSKARKEVSMTKGAFLPAATTSSMLPAMTTFIFFGCIFLGISGFIYYKNKSSGVQKRIFSRVPPGEAEVEMAAGEDADPLLA